MADKSLSDMVAAENRLREAAQTALNAGFNHGDLKNASDEKVKIFGDLFSALRLWLEATKPGDGPHYNLDIEEFPPDKMKAKTVVDMVTPKQLWLIRGRARDLGIDIDLECEQLCNCSLEELSKRAASAYIRTLNRKAGKDE